MGKMVGLSVQISGLALSVFDPVLQLLAKPDPVEKVEQLQARQIRGVGDRESRVY